MTFIQQLVNGLSSGAIYALIAIGFSLVYGVLRFVNFAHGDVYMFGTFVTFLAFTQLQMNFIVAGLLGILSGALLSMAVELVASRPVRNAPPVIPMMTTYGAALVIRSFVESRQGSAVANFPAPLTGESLLVGGIQISTLSIVTLVVAFLSMALFSLYLKYAKTGYGIRAASQDMQAASLMGIPTTSIVVLVFAAGGALGVIGGILYSSQYGIFFVAMGLTGLLKGFAAAVIGGIGSLKGAMVGGLLLGVIESLAGPYVSGAYRDAIAFVLLAAILVVRPNGLFGKPVMERV